MENKKIVLITGGSRGLGRDMAINVAKKGIDVVITYHTNQKAAKEVVEEIESHGQKAIALPLDTSSYESYGSFFKEVLNEAIHQQFDASKIDYLVNNAGSGHFAPFEETSINAFKDMIHIHLMASYFLTQQSLPYMNDGGGVINITTGLTRFSMPGYSAYAAAKGGVEVLSRYQALELGNRKIRVNTVAPGALETDFGGGVVRDNDVLNTQIASATALGRVGLPNDIGAVVAFLCTPEAFWINGQRIEVSGGVSL